MPQNDPSFSMRLKLSQKILTKGIEAL